MPIIRGRERVCWVKAPPAAGRVSTRVAPPNTPSPTLTYRLHPRFGENVIVREVVESVVERHATRVSRTNIPIPFISLISLLGGGSGAPAERAGPAAPSSHRER